MRDRADCVTSGVLFLLFKPTCIILGMSQPFRSSVHILSNRYNYKPFSVVVVADLIKHEEQLYFFYINKLFISKNPVEKN